MCEREGDDADGPMRSSCGVPALLCQDHSNGRQPAPAATALRHLPRQNLATATGAATSYQQELAGM